MYRASASRRSVLHSALGKEHDEDIIALRTLLSTRTLRIPMTVPNHHAIMPGVGKGFTYICKDGKHVEQVPRPAYVRHTNRERDRRKFYKRKATDRKKGWRPETVGDRGTKLLVVSGSPWWTNYIVSRASDGEAERVKRFYIGAGYTLLRAMIQHVEGRWRIISGAVHLDTSNGGTHHAEGRLTNIGPDKWKISKERGPGCIGDNNIGYIRLAEAGVITPEDKEGWSRYQQSLRRIATCKKRCGREPLDYTLANLLDQLCEEEFKDANPDELRLAYREAYYIKGWERAKQEDLDVRGFMRQFAERMPQDIFSRVFGVDKGSVPLEAKMPTDNYELIYGKEPKQAVQQIHGKDSVMQTTPAPMSPAPSVMQAEDRDRDNKDGIVLPKAPGNPTGSGIGAGIEINTSEIVGEATEAALPLAPIGMLRAVSDLAEEMLGGEGDPLPKVPGIS